VPDELWAQRDQPALQDIKWAGIRHCGGETVPVVNIVNTLPNYIISYYIIILTIAQH